MDMGKSKTCGREHCRRWQCVLCAGGGICHHGKRRSICKTCSATKGSTTYLCCHGKQRNKCTQGCGARKSVCIHSRVRSDCRECGRHAGATGLCAHNRRRRECKQTQCCRRGIAQSLICKYKYVKANLDSKDGEYKPDGSKCSWDGEWCVGGEPTAMICSRSDMLLLRRLHGLPPLPRFATHYCMGFVLFQQPRRVTNMRRDLLQEWRRWEEQQEKAVTVNSLTTHYSRGWVYPIKKRYKLRVPVPVKCKRNYGDGWTKSSDVEYRWGIDTPPWIGLSKTTRSQLIQSL